MKTLLALGLTLSFSGSWTKQITATGSGSNEQQARNNVRALCQGFWSGWFNRCQQDGGTFDTASTEACFRFAPVCTGFQSSWNCNYFTSVTCTLP